MKRVLSLVLCAVFMLSLFASRRTRDEPAPPVSVWDRLTFGSFDGAPIEWRVLDISNGRALVISEEILTQRMYNGDFADKNGNGDVYGDTKEWDLNGNGEWDQEEWERFSCTWETSDIRKWLNGSFYSGAFSGGEKRGIAETTISNPYNAEWGTDGGNKTSDKVFLLSLDEAERYFSNDGDRAANYGNDGAWWWLRSPGAYVSGAAGVVGGGIVYDSGNYVFGYYGGVRPALYINL